MTHAQRQPRSSARRRGPYRLVQIKADGTHEPAIAVYGAWREVYARAQHFAEVLRAEVAHGRTEEAGAVWIIDAATGESILEFAVAAEG
jgi:hypothetical protein